MPCYHPQTVYRFPPEIASTKYGKPGLFFGNSAADLLREFGEYHWVEQLPCSRCIGCKMKRAQEWSNRCMHEARYHRDTCFLTLTYKTKALPANKSLDKKHFQDFMKRLRQELARKHGVDEIRYYMCGEYGDARERPHYHAIIYGWKFPDRIPAPQNAWAEHTLYASEQLDRLWGHGMCMVGELTEKSAQYVALYTMKKMYGTKADREYEQTKRIPPYSAMSKGIGRAYFAEFAGDMYPSDHLVSDQGIKIPVPRFYDKLFEDAAEGAFKRVKEARNGRALMINPKDTTPERLAAREECLKERVKFLRRNYETNRLEHA